jgi:Tetracyclin repressor-like, C-terminal domain
VSLVASQVVGLGIARYVLCIEPLASTDGADFVAAIGPAT